MTPAPDTTARAGQPRVSQERLAQLLMQGTPWPWLWSGVRTREDGRRVLDVYSATSVSGNAEITGVAYVFYDDRRPEIDRASRRDQQLIASAPDIALDLADDRATIADLRQQIEALTAERDHALRENEVLASKDQTGVIVTNYYDLGKEFGCPGGVSPFLFIMDWKETTEARALAAEAERDAVIERAAKIAETCADASTSSRGCRASSYDGRCGERIAVAIRALSSTKEEGGC